MSTADFVLDAELREDEGKGASRRLRHQGKVPAILYGGDRKPRSITLDANELMKQARNEAFFSQVLTIKVDSVTQSAIVKDMQMHPAKARILHVDFQRVMDNVEIRMSIPLHFINEGEAPGVKTHGGVVSHLKNEVEIACLPKDLPEFLEVDLTGLEMDSIVHMSDIKLPSGVAIPELAQGSEYDQPVLSIHAPKRVVEPTEDDEAPAAPEAGADEAEAGDDAE